MSENDDDLAALREQTSHGDRIEEAAAEDAKRNLVEDILDALEAIDAGDPFREARNKGCRSVVVPAVETAGSISVVRSLGRRDRRRWTGTRGAALVRFPVGPCGWRAHVPSGTRYWLEVRVLRTSALPWTRSSQ